MMMVEKRLAAIKMIIKDVSFLDVFWALSFVLYYAFGLVGFAITQALSSLVSFQSKGIRLWSWSSDSSDRDVNTESGKQ
jgi:steroid 5-alpha reductase family enzyme